MINPNSLHPDFMCRGQLSRPVTSRTINSVFPSNELYIYGASIQLSIQTKFVIWKQICRPTHRERQCADYRTLVKQGPKNILLK